MLNSGLEKSEERSFVTFGPFVIDRQGQEVHKHGIRLKIAPQALRVLLCLTKEAPKLVPRKALFQTLWPGGVHVDFEGNLNAVIRDLREVLGDSARNPRYIETEPRRGYRFIAPVNTVAAEPVRAPERASLPEMLERPRKGSRRMVALG